mmetsp:Transcript_27459/g.51253  ORF Transcript_27459/g.51253 Transcript_27459/m.51253 type:complete len:105 (-) Transcript_27459:139-453(-)
MAVANPRAATVIATTKITNKLIVLVPHKISPKARANKEVDANHAIFRTLLVASDGQQAIGMRKNGDNGSSAKETQRVTGAAIVYQSPPRPIFPKDTALTDSGPR